MFKYRKTLLFALFVTILTLWQPDYIHNDNSTSRALAVMSLVEEGTLHFDQYADHTGDKSFINGHIYSDKAPLPVFLVYPAVKLIQISGLYPLEFTSRLNLVLIIGGYLLSSIPLILLMIFLFVQLEKNGSSYKNYWLATLPFVAGFIWIYNASFINHIFSGFLICFIFLSLEKKKVILAGILSGLAFLSEYPVIVIPFIWMLQVVIKERKINQFLPFFIGFFPFVILLFLYNYLLSGQWFHLGYDYVSNDYAQMKQNYGFALPSLKAIWGMTFSSYRGLLFFAPLFFPIAFFALIQFGKVKKNIINYMIHPWFVPFIIYLILISSYFMWWGGWSFGPRHLIPVVLFVFFYELQQNYLKKYFMPILIIGFAGLIFTLIVKSTVMYGFPSGLNSFTEVLFPAIENGVYHQMNLPTILFGLKPASSAIIWLAIYLSAGILTGRVKDNYNFVSSTPDIQ